MKKKINGKYFDNYFWILLNTNLNPKKILYSESITNTLIHEYIHFIQNISTSYGIQNIAQTYSSIAHFFNSKNKKLPFQITNCNFAINKYLMEISEKRIVSSDYKAIFNKNDFNISYDYLEKIKTVDLIKDLKLKEYKIYIQQPGKKTETYYFDVTAIEEGMCRIYEEHISQDYSDFYQIPYSLPEIMAKIIFPQILGRRELIFSICDISLMYTNPPELFVDILLDLKSKKYIPKSIPELYNYCYEKMQVNDGIKLKDFWDTIYKEARDNICDSCNFKQSQYAKDWIVKTLDFYHIYRLYIPYFLSLPLSKTPKETLTCICKLITINKSPVISNLRNQYCALSQTDMSKEQQAAMFHFMEVKCMNEFVFNSNGECCTFDRFCKEFETCPYSINYPLSKKIINGQVCVFQKNAISYGMRDLMPK